MVEYLSFQGLNDTTDGDHELLFNAKRNYNLNGLFKTIVEDQDWRFSEAYYNQKLSSVSDYKFSHPLPDDQWFCFTSKPDKEDTTIRRVGFYINDTQKHIALVSIKATAYTKSSSKLQECKMWINEKNLDAVDDIAEEFCENSNEVIKCYGAMMKHLVKHSRDSASSDYNNVA